MIESPPHRRDQGPEVASLLHRLTECPVEFQLEPRMGGAGRIRVGAVVADLMVELGDALPEPGSLSLYEKTEAASRNTLRLVLLACWLLWDPFFAERGVFAAAARMWLEQELPRLAALVDSELFLRDEERREELVRRLLAALSLHPAGESVQQAADRLRTLDSIERQRLLELSRKQQERVAAIQRELAERAAREAAAKISRE